MRFFKPSEKLWQCLLFKPQDCEYWRLDDPWPLVSQRGNHNHRCDREGGIFCYGLPCKHFRQREIK